MYKSNKIIGENWRNWGKFRNIVNIGEKNWEIPRKN
jgi:hypothetical protein